MIRYLKIIWRIDFKSKSDLAKNIQINVENI